MRNTNASTRTPARKSGAPAKDPVVRASRKPNVQYVPPADMRRKTSRQLLALDMRACVQGRKPELGMAKDDNGNIRVITSNSASERIRTKRAFSAVLARVALSPGMQNLLPPEVRAAYDTLKRTVPRGTPAEIHAAEDTLCEIVGRLASASAALMRDTGIGVTDLSASDMALYFVASALAATQRTIEIRRALPTITGILPITRYNTTLKIWTDFFEQEYASLSEPDASDGGGFGSGGHPDRERIQGALRRLKQRWALENTDIEEHNDARGREGAPEWDLMDRTLQINSAALMVDEARYIAFGSNPGTIVPNPPVNMNIPGWLYSKTPVPVDLDDASGLVVYDAARAFMLRQRVASEWAGGLEAGVLTLSPSRYFTLKGQFVNSGGMDINVIDALLRNVAGLREVRVAREYQQLPGELAALNGLGHPQAALVAGGVFVGTDADNNVVNALREAVTLHIDDPLVVSILQGHDIMVQDNALVDGAFSGAIKLSTGGTWVAQPEGVQIGYQVA